MLSKFRLIDESSFGTKIIGRFRRIIKVAANIWICAVVIVMMISIVSFNLAIFD